MSKRFTAEELAKPREIAEAEAATPWPYEVVGPAGYGGPYALRVPHRSGRTWYGVESIKRREDGEYFAAMNRNTVLELLDKIERLRRDLIPEAPERYQQLVDSIIDVGTGYGGGASDA